MLGVLHAVGLAVGDDDGGVVQEPVQDADGGGLLGKEAAPFFERPVRADGQGSAFVGAGDEPEQQLCSGVVERGEAQFVEDDQVDAQQGFDDLADGVVGQAAVEGFDEVGGGEVADLVPGVDGGDPQPDQGVRLAGPGRSDDRQILLCAYPFQTGQVVERLRWIEEAATSNDSSVLVTGNPAALSRLTTLEASRAASSVSTRVRSTSSGVQR